MKNSTRRVSMLLAIMMVLSLFAAFPMMVGAADTNYASGLTPLTVTKGGADFDATAQGALTILTDGAEVTAYGETVRLSGTTATFAITYDLGAVKTDVSSVYLSLFYNGSSYGGIISASVDVSSDNATYNNVYSHTAGYTLADTTAGVKSYAFNFTATSARYVKITFVSEKYYVGLSEIAIRNYASTGTAAEVVELPDPTLVDGNYAYGGTYTIVKVGADGTESDPTYKANMDDAAGNWLTDGYEGEGSELGTAYKTVVVQGTGATHTLNLTLSASQSDVNYITLYNAPLAGTSYCYPSSVVIKTSTDGITYNDVTYTEVMTPAADEKSYDISYVFANAVSAQYIQFTWTQTLYQTGFDEFWVGGTATTPDIPESSSSEDSVITADPTVITSGTATNYAPNGYYQYGANSSCYPWTSSPNGDASFAEAGKYGKGELNNAIYAADNVNNSTEWVAILGSEVYNTINQVEIIFDLAAVYGDIDQIVLNYYRHGGDGEDGYAPDYAKVNELKVSFGDYNGTYGAETSIYAGTVTETVNGYASYKNQYAVGALAGTTGVRFVKIIIPKTVYRVVLDEIEIIGASGYDIVGEPPVDSSEDPVTSEDPSSEDPSNPYPYFTPSFTFELSAQLGNFDPDGPDYAEFTEGEYIAVDITLTDLDKTNYPYGMTSFEGKLYFDEANLVPAFVTSDHLNGNETTNPKPGPVYSWPTFTKSQTIPGVGTFEVEVVAATGACWAYAYVLSDGTLVGADGIPSTETDDVKNKEYTIGLGWTDLTFMTENYTAAEGVYVEDNIIFRYYFAAKDGVFAPGESYTFDLDDSQNSDWIGDAQLTGASYAGPGVQPSYTTVVGKSTPVTFTVPAEEVYYTVTFVDKDGNEISSESVLEGTAATAPTAPEVEGYTFSGWDKDFTAVTEDMTVTAQYEQIMVTVTFVADANGTLNGTTSVSVAYGTDLSTVTFPEAVANDGYEFSAWSATSGVITVDTTVTATFTAKAVEPSYDHFTAAEGADLTNVVVSTTTDYIYFKAAGISGANFKALFVDEDISIVKANGTTAVADTALVGSGYLATSTIDGVAKTRTIIVFGDATGDGRITTVDYGRVLGAVKGSSTLTGALRVAANVVAPNTDSLTTPDYGRVLAFVKGSVSAFAVSVS